MKPLMTVLGICALLAVTGSAFADPYTWDGDGSAADWSDEDNWGGSGYPDDGDDCSDSATIESRVGGGFWPELDDDYCVTSLTMSNGTSGSPTQIDTYHDSTTTAYTLTVSGTFTVTDTNSSCYVEVTGSGAISCGSLSVQGGDSSGETATLKVSAGTVSTS